MSDAHLTTKKKQDPCAHRLLFLDTKVKQRYLANPPGFRKQWGPWTLVDRNRSLRPGGDLYTKSPNRDVPFSDFPPKAWQKDKDYLAQFLNGGIDLTKRAMQATLAEYGKVPANSNDLSLRTIKNDLLFTGENVELSLVCDSLSGWMDFNIEHGMIIPTAEWCSENNEEVYTSCILRERSLPGTEEYDDTSMYSLKQESPHLKAKPFDYCTSLDLEAWKSLRNQVQHVVGFWIIEEDPSFEGENVEFAIRVTGCGGPIRKAFALTHTSNWA